MAFEHYLRSGDRLLRCGYTTGSCAALAAAGAVRLLLTGKAPTLVQITTPKGWPVEVEPEICRMEGESALCAVRKDAGDDPDVTDGALICAQVSKALSNIEIDGGPGVGRVTKPGLDQPAGAAAINTVPRRMIREAAEMAASACGYGGGLRIVISVPAGERIAERTFNPRLGIEGGISILGSSGVVEPMSERAIIETTALEIRQAAAAGYRKIILLPGNYGMDYLSRKLPELAEIPRARCSNYIGEALDEAALAGFLEVLLIGHVGKLVKLAGGIMNTHSRTADCRRELFVCHAALCGADTALCTALMEQVSTEGCLAVLEGAGLREKVTKSLLSAIQEALSRRCGEMRAGALLFSESFGLLGMTTEAEKELKHWRKNA